MKFLLKIFKSRKASTWAEPLPEDPQPLRSNHSHAFALAGVFLPNIPDSHEAAVGWKRFQICATTSPYCMLGAMAWCSDTPEHGVQIFGDDSHPLNPRDRHADYLNLIEGRPRTHYIPFAPVEIGKDCCLGANSIVLKGMTIGARSVVDAGSVVTADLGEDCLAAGNPARVVRSLS